MFDPHLGNKEIEDKNILLQQAHLLFVPPTLAEKSELQSPLVRG